MNKTALISSIKEKTGKSDDECIIIGEILDSHFVIGKNNKEKIVADFVEKLNIPSEEADELYNVCAESIVKGIFHKK